MPIQRALLTGCLALGSLAVTPAQAQETLEEFVEAVSTANTAQELAPIDARWLEPAMRIAASGKAEPDGAAVAFEQRPLLIEAFAWTRAEDWRAVIDGWQAVDADRRLGGLLVIAHHGDASDLERAEELCDYRGDVWREEFRATCGRLFTRDGAFESVASKRLWYLPTNLGEELIHATADVGGEPAYDFLERVLRGREELWPVALADLFRLAQARPWELPEDLLDYVEGLLRSHDPATRREAAKLMGLAAFDPAVEQLIEMLEDEEAGVAQAAHWALEQASSQKLPPEATRWRSWLAGARRWWSERGDQVLSDIESDDPHVALAALKELARQRYRRREISRAAVPLLLAPDPVLAEVAAGLIGRLGDGSEAPELIAALGRSEDRVRGAAGAALRHLFDTRIEDDPVAWSRYWRQQQDAAGS
jgi:hypothetical protein